MIQPTFRQAVALLACLVVLSFGAAAAMRISEPEPATAARASAEVSELRKIGAAIRESNRQLAVIAKSIGSDYDGEHDAITLLTQICRNTTTEGFSDC